MYCTSVGRYLCHSLQARGEKQVSCYKARVFHSINGRQGSQEAQKKETSTASSPMDEGDSRLDMFCTREPGRTNSRSTAFQMAHGYPMMGPSWCCSRIETPSRQMQLPLGPTSFKSCGQREDILKECRAPPFRIAASQFHRRLSSVDSGLSRSPL